MYNRGLFWAAIIRSLLAMRRDQNCESSSHSHAIKEIANLENGHLNPSSLTNILDRLMPDDSHERTGKSLAGYLDFNKMGNFVVLLTSLRNISEVLETLSRYPQLFLGENSQFKYSIQNEVTLSWRCNTLSKYHEVEAYFLFILFRHLSGRQFDFDKITLPSKQSLNLMSALSNAHINQSEESIAIAFDPKWLKQTSFFYSAQLVKMLTEGLDNLENLPLKKRLLSIFNKSDAPARVRIDWVASELDTTETNLRRQLRQENVSFSSILKSYIHDISCHNLLSGKKSEATASLLGYSDRRAFERSFKEFSGISAGQVRQLGNRLRFQKGNSHLIDVVDNLPPLPHTITQLVNMDNETATVDKVVSIIEQDPIFQAHIMSKASRAVFGSSPKNLHQAVGRNLGVSSIKHLAVVFAAQQLLTLQCRHSDVQKLTDAMLLSQILYQKVFGLNQTNADTEVTKQVLLFGLLSLFIVFHEECVFVEGTMQKWESSTCFNDFTDKMLDEFGVCLYGATTLMLLRWGFKSSAIQQLWRLCKVSAVEEDEVNQHIKLCHNIAFSAIGFNTMADIDEMISRLTADQQSRLSNVLTQWQDI